MAGVIYFIRLSQLLGKCLCGARGSVHTTRVTTGRQYPSVYSWPQVMEMPVMGFRHLSAPGILSIGAEEDRDPPPQQPARHEKTKLWLSPPAVEPCSPGHRSLLGPSVAMAVPDGERSTGSLSTLSITRLNLSLMTGRGFQVTWPVDHGPPSQAVVACPVKVQGNVWTFPSFSALLER